MTELEAQTKGSIEHTKDNTKDPCAYKGFHKQLRTLDFGEGSHPSFFLDGRTNCSTSAC